MRISYETQGAVAVFTIENGSVNPITPQMHRQMSDALTEFENDRGIKVGVLRGAGNRAFSAGDDIKSPREQLDQEERILRHFFGPRSPTDYNYPGFERDILTRKRFKPIVGAVNGWCIGEGLFYLLHLTDLRVAGAGAKFAFPEIAFNLAGASGFARIYRHLPRAAAMKMVLTGDAIDAAEAQRIHLINEVVPDDAVVERAHSLAARIARHPALAIRVEMETFVRGEDLDSGNAYAMADHIYRVQRQIAPSQDPIDFQGKGVKG